MRFSRLLLSAALLLGISLAATAGWCAAEAPTPTTFSAPPQSAKPWVYWFWSNGNITREGITADLEAMHRVGIGGVLIMEVDQGIPLRPRAICRPEVANCSSSWSPKPAAWASKSI